jgi:hypothetical protein
LDLLEYSVVVCVLCGAAAVCRCVALFFSFERRSSTTTAVHHTQSRATMRLHGCRNEARFKAFFLRYAFNRETVLA